VSPFALLETQDGKKAPRGVADQYRSPDTGRLELTAAIEEKTDARWKEHL